MKILLHSRQIRLYPKFIYEDYCCWQISVLLSVTVDTYSTVKPFICLRFLISSITVDASRLRKPDASPKLWNSWWPRLFSQRTRFLKTSPFDFALRTGIGVRVHASVEGRHCLTRIRCIIPKTDAIYIFFFIVV